MHTETSCLSYIYTDNPQGQELLALNLNQKSAPLKAKAKTRQCNTELTIAGARETSRCKRDCRQLRGPYQDSQSWPVGATKSQAATFN